MSLRNALKLSAVWGSRQAIQQVVDDLERLGIVESRRDPEDGRARRVRYTTWGREGYERCMGEFGRLELELVPPMRRAMRAEGLEPPRP